jgi:hypothetical protein
MTELAKLISREQRNEYMPAGKNAGSVVQEQTCPTATSHPT